MRRHKVGTTQPKPGSILQAQRKARNSEPARQHLFLQSRPITNPNNEAHMAYVTASTGKAICADAGGSVTSQKRTQHQFPARLSAVGPALPPGSGTTVPARSVLLPAAHHLRIVPPRGPRGRGAHPAPAPTHAAAAAATVAAAHALRVAGLAA